MVLENPIEGADGGADLRLRKNGELTLAQCNHRKSKSFGISVVREFF
jgi:restriction system protein